MLWPLVLAALIGGAEPKVVSGDLPVQGGPVWVDDGKRLAFRALVDGEQEWFLTSPDGAEPKLLKLRPRPIRPEQVWFSPTGDALLYLAQLRGARTMMRTSLAAEEPMALAVLGDIEPVTVAWARDSSRVAFGVKAPQGSAKPYELFSAEAGGADGNRIPMETPPDGITWDGSGRRYAYVSRDPGRPVLFVCNHDLHRAVAVSPNLSVYPRSIVWAPGDQALIFAGAAKLNEGAHLFVGIPDGHSYAEKIERPGLVGNVPPVLSPDGRWMAWVTGILSDPENGGAVLGQVGTLERAKLAGTGLGAAGEMSFSHDSKWLLMTGFDSREPRRSRLARVSVTEPEYSEVLDPGPIAGWATLSPDGKWLAWCSGTEGKVAVKVQAWSSGPREG